LALLNHPNITRIYGVEGGALVEGKTRKASAPHATALDYARQMSDGLEQSMKKGSCLWVSVRKPSQPASLAIQARWNTSAGTDPKAGV
jgi:hypothetical protein